MRYRWPLRLRRVEVGVAMVVGGLGFSAVAAASGAPAVSAAPAAPARASVVASTRHSAKACKPNLGSELRYHNRATEIFTLVTAGYGNSYATFQAWIISSGCWVAAFGPWQARVGYNGISTDKHEGDGTTPAGLYGFDTTMYGNAPDPGVAYPYVRLKCGDWWDEDSASPMYNEFVVVPCSDTNPPFNNGASERLWTETVAYPSFAVVNYNTRRIPGKGSAIFLHADDGYATSGCISLPLHDLDEVLDWMHRGDNPSIAIGTTWTIKDY